MEDINTTPPPNQHGLIPTGEGFAETLRSDDHSSSGEARVPKELDFETLMEQVARGEWGRGQARRKALADAGWDPNKVQRELIARLNGRVPDDS